MSNEVRPVTIFDCDNVLSDTEAGLQPALLCIVQKEGIEGLLKNSDLSVDRLLEVAHGVVTQCDDYRVDEVALTVLKRPDFILSLEPIEGALESVKLAHLWGYDVHIVTARTEETQDVSSEWLKIHGFTPYVKELHHRSADINVLDFKITMAKALRARAFFEDDWRIGNIMSYKHQIPIYLVRRDWNISIKGSNRNPYLKAPDTVFRQTMNFLLDDGCV